jgi:predicted permease
MASHPRGTCSRALSWLEGLRTDVRHVLRALFKKPGYALAVILTLALGIGANAVVFALVTAVVLRPLPYPNAERLISLSQTNFEGRDSRVLQDVAYDEWRQMSRSAELSAAYAETQVVLGAGGRPDRVIGVSAMPAYFQLLGVRPLVGRLFSDGEAQSRARVVILSEQLWRARFNADSGIVGSSVTLDGAPWQVIGVLPAAFVKGRPERFWTPLRLAPVRLPPSTAAGEFIGYSVLARLRDGVPRDAVRLELATVLARLSDREDGGRPRPVVMSLHERRHGSTRRPLLLLFGAVGTLLLTACANIANLGLARAARREREFALRRALGASRSRIVRFVLVESLALSAAGAALGLALVRASLAWVVTISPGTIGDAAQMQSIGVNGMLVAFASAVAILTAVVFGIVPAVTASRAPLNRTLASGTAQSAGSARQSRLRRTLVTLELAVALVFLTGAGLVTKTFWRVATTDPGFRPERLVVANIALGDGYTNATARVFFDDLMMRLRHEPGVQSTSYSRGGPVAGTGGSISLTVEVGPRARGAPPRRPWGYTEVGVDTAYFKTMGAQLVAGRLIGPEDREGSQRVAVVTEEFVRLNLNGAPPIGRAFGGREGYTVIGVVKDITHEPHDGEIYPLIFVPLAQSGGDEFQRLRDLIVRTTGEPERLEATIRAAVESLDPALPPPTFTTMERALAEVVAPRMFTLVLLGAFAALALGLAVIGLFSVLAYLVAERTREIGVRMALGADARRVARMVLGEGLRLTLWGTLLGGALSLAAVRVLRAWVYEMSVYDAPTFAAVAALLCVVALGASWLPARWASRVDPVRALRAD